MPATTVTSHDEIALAVHDLGGNGHDALLVHATSFHGEVFAPLARLLGARWHCYAPDVRGHGRSRAGLDLDLSWTGLADDLLAILDALELHQPIGFGHSSGASALLLAEARRPGSFASLYCYEPIVLDDALRRSGLGPPNPERARNRRAKFDNRAEALSQYQERAAFARLDPEVLAAYVEHGFTDEPDGSVTLSCAPEVEARFYEEGYAHDVLYPGVVISCPVVIAVGGESRDLGRACAPVVNSFVPSARIIELPGLTHLGPLEAPSIVATSIITEIETPTT